MEIISKKGKKERSQIPPNYHGHYTDYIIGWERSPISEPLEICGLKSLRARCDVKPVQFFWDNLGGYSAFYDYTGPNCLLQIEARDYELPFRLTPLAKEIEESRYIYSLPECWDEEKAKQISQSLWNISISFLLDYAMSLFSHFDVILETPEINPVPNGTIDFSWRTKLARMLINVRMEGNEYLAYYYGDLYQDRFPIKGSVPTDIVTSHLMQWMKDNISEK